MKSSWIAGLAGTTLLALILATTASVADSPDRRSPTTVAGETAPAREASEGHWVHTWSATPQLTEPENMPPPPFTEENRVLADTTLRQTVRVTGGGERLRLRFSNAFGDADLPLTAVSVALPRDGEAGTSAIEPGTSRRVTFNGRAAVTVPVGAQMVSDPVDMTLRPGANLTVTVYLADGQASTEITSHPGSRTTSHLLRHNHVDDEELDGATPVDHWYFLSGVETWSPPDTAAVAVLGDSLTDGRGSTTNGNDRWPDLLFDRLRAEPATSRVTVLNQAAGGNRVLHDGLGPNALARLDRDVLAHSGVRWLVVLEGVNDIGTAEATEEAQKQVGDDLLAAYEQIVTRAHAQGIRVYGATLLPFGGNEPYDDPAGLREATRQRVNTWIRTSGRFDAVVDLDRAVRDPEHPERLRPDLHDGDWLHLTPEGYRELADAVPTELFQPTRGTPAPTGR